jgi:hypothetical protein
MNNNSALKVTIIGGLIVGLIVSAISIFLLTPLHEKISEKKNPVISIVGKDISSVDVKDEQNNARDCKTNTVVTEKTNTNKVGVIIPLQGENYNSYINASIANSNSKTKIAVTVVDEERSISSISSSIANIYNRNGFFGFTDLIRSSFIQKTGFQELYEGNSEIIDKLNLNNYVDYVALGKISSSTRNGTEANGTFISSITLTMNIISVNQKGLIKSFTCSANGNGVTEDQAKKYAIHKLLSKYNSEYSSIQ